MNEIIWYVILVFFPFCSRLILIFSISSILEYKQLAQAHDQIVVPLENFRKDRIGGVKESKKKFDKKTAKFCQAQERFLNMSSKKPDNTIQEVIFFKFLFRY